ncbi:hypothetical protein SANT12839_034640 [Streptomyces antimycoticus]|uniref:Uncharacterized protein n=1 Tax=Streptomyces antimycoticus TaxID=68175 RepID=A0A4D4K399_9ACTN|nr:hypothetical protein [Streptomyces antimycoticus]GDY42582.1 hypothetical protein SANT12839_034640 [Streptomyces antimycoticus]
MRGLDALNLMTLLRTEHLPKRGVGRVTVVIDACWQALPLRTHTMVATPEELTRKPEINRARDIYWMRACRPGAVSKNQQGAGLFSAVLLRQLQADSIGGAAPDLDRVWQGIRDEFARLGEVEGLTQFPTVHISRGDGDGEDIPLGPPPPPLDEPQRRERSKLIHAVGALLGRGPVARRTSPPGSASSSPPPRPPRRLPRPRNWSTGRWRTRTAPSPSSPS